MPSVVRLYNQFQPTHYTVVISPNAQDRIFSGSVTITGVLLNAQPSLWLHSKGLTIVTATIDDTPAKVTQESSDEISLHTKATLAAAEHTLSLEFRGVISEQMHGIYPCKFEYNTIKKELLSTQFESHHAREALPCIDEPEAKATFDLTLRTEPDVVVLGNMPIQQQSTKNGVLVTRFDTTPQMSIYLLAFVIGELHEVTAKSKNGVDVSIWSTISQKKSDLAFALQTAVKTLDYYEDYFGVPYPLPKSDHVALPDFAAGAGAMENWGLITYREVGMLYDPQHSSLSSKQYIATVIAHELSHMWFGDLVTMKWWDDLWLNESFASLMEYVALDALYPEWEKWAEFSIDEGLPSLNRDSLDGVQAVMTEVLDPAEIPTLFDGAIVYAKGSRLMRMLHNFVGDTAFRAGLKAYFEKYAYKNTVGDNLWQALSEASGKDVGTFMNTWIQQPGFPLVSVQTEKSNITLRQQRFFIGPHHHNTSLWPIPLDSSPVMQPNIFATQTAVIKTNAPLLKLNCEDKSHYITRYDDAITKRQYHALRHGTLSATDKLQLLHEAGMLARAGFASSAHSIHLLQTIGDEQHKPVWNVIAQLISDLRRFGDVNIELKPYVKKLVGTICTSEYNRLGIKTVPGEKDNHTKLRPLIISLASYGELQPAIDQALELVSSSNNLISLDAEMRSVLLSIGVKHSSKSSQLVERLLHDHTTTNSSEYERDIAAAVCTSRDPKIITLLLEKMQDTSFIRTQDVLHWFVYLTSNEHAKQASWDWLRANWSFIVNNFGSDNSFDYWVKFCARSMNTATELIHFQEFFDDKKSHPNLRRAIEMGEVEITGRIEWLTRDMTAVVKALSK